MTQNLVKLFFLQLLINFITASISINGTTCDLYQLSVSEEWNLTKNIVVMNDLCEITTIFCNDCIILTDFEGCSIEKRAANAYLMGASAIIIRSVSIVEDAIWNTKYHIEEPIHVLIMMTNCKINENTISNNEIITIFPESNPFGIQFIIMSVFLEIWNFINLIMIIYNIRLLNPKKHFFFVSYLILELFISLFRTIIFLEPLPQKILNTYSSYNILYGINFACALGSVILICTCFINSLGNKNKLKIMQLSTGIKDNLNNHKYPLIIIGIMLIIEIVFGVIRSMYLYVKVLQYITLIYYLVAITIIFILYIITCNEIHNFAFGNKNGKVNPARKRLFIKMCLLGAAIVTILIGLVFYLLISINNKNLLSLKVLVMWIGFCLLSSCGINLCNVQVPKKKD